MCENIWHYKNVHEITTFVKSAPWSREKGSQVTQTAFIEELKLLDNTYTCIAANDVGANSVTITLKEINNGKISSVRFTSFFIHSLDIML